MLNFPLEGSYEDEWMTGLDSQRTSQYWPQQGFRRQIDRHSTFEENRRIHRTFQSDPVVSQRLNYEERGEADDESEELLPLNSTASLNGKRLKYGALSLKNATTLVNRNFFTHTLLPNETLAGIAIKYNVTVEDLKRANGLVNDWDLWMRKDLQIPSIEKRSPNICKQIHPASSEKAAHSSEIEPVDFSGLLTVSRPDQGSLNGHKAQSREYDGAVGPNFDQFLAGIESGNADSLWTQIISEPRHQQHSKTKEERDKRKGVVTTTEMEATDEVKQKEEEEEVDNFFAKFDLKSAAVTKSALKTIKRIEHQQDF